MTNLVFAAVLGSAILHASWNALIKSSSDRVVSMALQDCVMLCIGLILIIFVAPIPGSKAFPYIVCSAATLIFYRIFLLKAYRHGDLSRSYPVARGVAPLLVACAGVLIGDDILSSHGYGAITLISVGIIGLIFSKKYAAGNRLDRGIFYALACGCMIAAYSVVDSRGVHLAGTVIGYHACLSIMSSSCLPTYVLVKKRRTIFPAIRMLGSRALIGGTSSSLGYLIVIWAYSQTSAVQVVALRETSVVFGALIGAYILKEGLGPRRVICSLLVALGVALLQFYR